VSKKSQGLGSIKVDGLRELQRQLRTLDNKAMKAELRKVNKDAATIVADEARNLVPVRSGRLRASIGARAGQTSASVKAGTGSRVPYAGPIHFGWPARNIRPQPFLYEALGKKWKEVYNAYDKNVSDLVKKFNRSK
jgi:HK97 gp10 family phage protein